MSLYQNILVVDSKDRISGTPNKFVAKFLNISHVEKIALEKIVIPFTWYQITAFNNAIRFNDGTQRDIVIPVGVYSPSTLVTAIKTAMDGSPSSLVFSVQFNDTKKKITISETGGPTVFSLQFNIPNSAGPILGYSNNDFTGSASYTASNILNLSYNNSFVNVYSRIINRHDRPIHSSDFKGQFLKVTNNFTTWGGIIDEENLKDIVLAYDPGSTLDKIDLELTDPQDNPIDFNGVDGVLLYLKVYTRI